MRLFLVTLGLVVEFSFGSDLILWDAPGGGNGSFY